MVPIPQRLPIQGVQPGNALRDGRPWANYSSERQPETSKHSKPFCRRCRQWPGQHPPNQVDAKEFEDIVHTCAQLQVGLPVERLKAIPRDIIVCRIVRRQTTPQRLGCPELTELELAGKGDEPEQAIAEIMLYIDT